MDTPSDSLSSIRRYWYAWAALVAGLALSVIASLEVKKALERDAALEFALASDQVALKIRERLAAYALTLKGGAGLFAASSNVSRLEWKAFVEKLRAQDSVPGVQGIGFAVVIPPEQLAAHIAKVRSEGFPDYTVRPVGDRPIYTSIIYLEPFRDRNLRAFGFDMFSEPVRRAAMERARDTGSPALSGKVQLVQETNTEVQAGTLMYVPVYRKGAPADTIDQRRSALIGWSYSPYRMRDLLEGILADWTGPQTQARMRIYDGTEPSTVNLLYDSRPDSAAHSDPAFFQRRTIDFNGRPWLLTFDAAQGVFALKYGSAWATLAMGVLLSGLLCGLMVALARTQVRAREIAAELTAEIKRKADALQDSENKLRGQTERYQLLLRSSSDGMCVMNAQGCIEETSDSFCAMLAYPRERVIGMHVSEWDATFSKEELSGMVAKTIADGRRVQFETRHRRSDGTVVPVEVSAFPLALDGKDVIFCLTRDITERKRADQEQLDRRDWLEREVAARTQALVEAKDAAEAANRAKTAFLANMSHELRTPMTAIMGMTDLARRRASDPKQAEHLEKVMSASEHLLRIINDILDLSRIVANRLPIQRIEFSLGETLDKLERMVGQAALDKNLKLLIQLEPGLLVRRVQGDPTRLEQVLINLVGNAIKFTVRGTISVRTERLEETPSELLLRWEIADTGIGIDEEAQARLFSDFEQADNSMTRKYGGTGLGLAISKRLVTMMGGEIGVESTLGLGSTFWFTVRLGKAGGAEVCASNAGRSQAAEEALRERYAGTRILLVEDEPSNRQVASSLLEEVGLLVDHAENGRQALDLARNHPYALILMDMQMPVMNGVEATQAIRALPGRAQTPILAMTANAFDEDRQLCIDAGMDEHISKPVSTQVLYERTLRWLEKDIKASPASPAASNLSRTV